MIENRQISKVQGGGAVRREQRRRGGCFILGVILGILVLFPPGQAMAATSEWDGSAVSTILSGSGSEIDPYLIQSAADLAYLAQYTNAGEQTSGKNYRLTTDIDLKAFPWIPIGKPSYPFRGIFEGNDHTIDGLAIGTSAVPNTDLKYVGLFGYANGAKINNLNVRNIAIYSKYSSASSSDFSSIGGIAGYITSASSLKTCYSAGTITVSSGLNNYSGGMVGLASSSSIISDCNSLFNINSDCSKEYHLGGLVCQIQSKSSVRDSYSGGTVTGSSATANANVGGLIGAVSNESSVRDCHSGSTINGNNAERVGGLIGRTAVSPNGVTISGCYATGSVRNSGTPTNKFIGGLVGLAGEGSSFIDCYASGDVTSNALNSSAGGFVGQASNSTYTYITTFKNCSAWGNVTGTHSNYDIGGTGGFAGYVKYYTSIENCFSRGKVTGSTSGSNNHLGGFIGYSMAQTLGNCYASGKVTQISGVNNAFVRTCNSGNITSSYFNSSINTGTGDNYATGMTTNAMRADQSTIGSLINLLNEQVAAPGSDGWKIWMVKNGSYPVFSAVDQDAPTGLGMIYPTNNDANDGQIINADSDMEYILSTSTDDEWTAVTGSSITGLYEGIYYVRYAEKPGCFPSDSTTIDLRAEAAKEITSYSIDIYEGIINESTHTISVKVPYGMDVTDLVATFTATGASVSVGETEQNSGTTKNNFTNPVIYTVTAENGTARNYIVTVSAT